LATHENGSRSGPYTKIKDDSEDGHALLRLCWKWGAPEVIAFIIRKIPYDTLRGDPNFNPDELGISNHSTAKPEFVDVLDLPGYRPDD
jgi:hypothetical protein